MIKVFQKLINSVVISIISIGIAFCLYSCDETEIDILGLALDSLKLDLNEVNESLYLVKQIFFNYEDVEYCFDVDWSYTSQEHWNGLRNLDNYFILDPKAYYDEFDFDLIATISSEEKSKSKTFHGHFVNIEDDTPKGIDILITLEEDEEITLEGMAINLYESNCFVFHDGEKSTLVEIDNSEILVYNIKIEIVLKVVKCIINIDGESIERTTAKYVNHRNINGTYGEKHGYKSIPYSLEYLYDSSKSINVENYNKLNQSIVQTKGVISTQNDDYFISLDDISLKISSKNNHFFKMLMIDCISLTCTVDLFVDFIIQDNIVLDYNFSMINIFINS